MPPSWTPDDLAATPDLRRAVEFGIDLTLLATVHGSAYFTYAVDVSYGRSTANVERLCRALAPVHPTLRGAPSGPPFRLDPPTVGAGLNFTLCESLRRVRSAVSRPAAGPPRTTRPS